MTDSFWAGGPAAYAKALHEEYVPLLDKLREKLDFATDDLQRTKIEAEVAKTESEFHSKLDDIGDSLF